MTLFFTGQSLTKSYASRTLFSDLNLSIFSGDRIGLIGPNGSGKSTLLKILAGHENADSGTLSFRKGLRIGYVAQSCEYPDLLPEEILMKALEKSARDEYEKDWLVASWLTKLGLTDKISAQKLSGGWKKRLSIAEQLILEPDLLLLDEPTNHLDLEGIVWLEKFLNKEIASYLLVSHDRVFLQNMVNRTIEINAAYPGGLFGIDGPYLQFLEKKESFLAGQIQQERSLASKARKELDWLRQSPKARTTKAKSRVDEAHEIMDDLSAIKGRNRQKKTTIDFVSTERETQKLLTAKNIAKSLTDRPLFQRLDLIFSPGMRLGLLGPNGSGKTTLLKMLAGEIGPDQGTIKRADGLKVVYFDQHRMQLSPDMTLKEALSPNGDYVSFHGQSIHVNGWCRRFLFSPDYLEMPIKRLSGGERARIQIAHLMLQPADLLLLDEPTNDLDIPTLETLEESLLEFPGAMVLITHDRAMLSRVCNLFLALGNQVQGRLFADYAQWESVADDCVECEKPKEKGSQVERPHTALTSAEKKELGQIEGKIVAIEEKIHQLNLRLESDEIVSDTVRMQTLCQEIALTQTQMEQLYLRWEELEKKRRG